MSDIPPHIHGILAGGLPMKHKHQGRGDRSQPIVPATAPAVVWWAAWEPLLSNRLVRKSALTRPADAIFWRITIVRIGYRNSSPWNSKVLWHVIKRNVDSENLELDELELVSWGNLMAGMIGMYNDRKAMRGNTNATFNITSTDVH